MILETLGEPDESDLSFISKPETVEYVKYLSSDKPKINFQRQFHKTNEELVGILTNMLEMNPYIRKKALDILKMDIFEDLKAQYPEYMVPPPYKIMLDIDEQGAYDYMSSSFKKLTIQDLKD